MNATRPTVGVVIPTYNSGKFVKDCLLSVLNQKYKPSQIVVCDDGSEDDTLAVVYAIKSQTSYPIEVIEHKHNIGIPRNFNSGLKIITSEYVSLIGGDDRWDPEKLQHEVGLLKDGVEAVYSACSIIDKNGNYMGPFKRKYDGVRGNILFEMLMHELAFRSPLLKVSLIRAIGYFDERLEIFEDWDLKIKYLARASVEYSSANTVFYRQHDAGISKRADRWKYYKNLKMVYNFNGPLIESFDDERRQMIVNRQRRDLLSHLRGAYDLVSNSKSLLLKLQWFKEYVVLNPGQCVKLALRLSINPKKELKS